jgi:hypothetical protein
MRRFFRALFWCATVTVVVLAVFGTAGVVLTRGWADATQCEPVTKCTKTPFDSQLWKAYGNWSDPVRIKMIDDLSQSYGLRGKPRAWIDEQLGTPDNNNPFPEECEYVYWLGPARTLVATEFEYLCLNFQAEVVADASIVTD